MVKAKLLLRLQIQHPMESNYYFIFEECIKMSETAVPFFLIAQMLAMCLSKFGL